MIELVVDVVLDDGAGLARIVEKAREIYVCIDALRMSASVGIGCSVLPSR